MNILRQSLKSSLIVTVLFIVFFGPASGLYVAALIIVPSIIVSIISTLIINLIFNKLNIVKRFDRIFLGISLPVLGSLVYLAGCTLMFGDVIAAIKDTWLIMMTINVLTALNFILPNKKVDKKD